MIRNPIDIASRVSPELSSIIETIIDLLLPEIDSLIERNGEDALAEEYLRYE